MVMASDIARCEGVKTPRGVPASCCILCLRRIEPAQVEGQQWIEEPPARFDPFARNDETFHPVKWICDMRIEYAQET